MADLAKAARFEVQLRADRYPLLVANSRMGEDEATVDYQAWHCIAVWLETGRFTSIDGGGIDGQTVISWARAEDAAVKGLAAVDRLIAKASEDKAASLHGRRWALAQIVRLVTAQRQLIETLNREFRGQGKAAA